MAAEISNVEGGVVTLRVSGRLTQRDLAAAQAETTRIIATAGKIRLLVLAEDFAGWEKGGQWSDFSFQQAHDDDIERMAIVGDEQWRDLTLLFTSQGLRPFPIEYFAPGRLAEARAWLGAAPGVRT
ncbi:MAG: STAS/SEC14 domain-containing protein [Gammaproteobacteria bacterium]|nr:STAS/SEC14 domain-containing protein [Gammaproteobacteria bacterium]